MTMYRRDALRLALAAVPGMSTLVIPEVRAQGCPDHPIKLLVGFPAGQSGIRRTDVAACCCRVARLRKYGSSDKPCACSVRTP